MAQISVISFDVFGTLIDIKEQRSGPETYEQLARWLGYHGVRVDGAKLQSRFETLIEEDLARSREAFPDVDVSQVLYQSINQLCPGSAVLPLILPDAALLLRTLTTVSLVDVPGAAEVLEVLDGKYRLGICSNTQRAYTISELRAFDLLKHFEHIIFSSDVLLSKPNPKIFETLISRFEVPAGAIVHVGDRIEDDVAGATACGIRAIWLEREHPSGVNRLEGSLPAGTPRIRTLANLPQEIHLLERDL